MDTVYALRDEVQELKQVSTHATRYFLCAHGRMLKSGAVTRILFSSPGQQTNEAESRRRAKGAERAREGCQESVEEYERRVVG